MSTRIVTVTPNPSLDRTIELSGELQRGAVQRATRSTAEPGGKGVNVSRVVVASGGDTVAVLPGDDLDPVLLGLATRGIPTAALPIGAPLRSNVTVTEPTGTTTKLNEPGPSLAGRLDDLAALVADTADATATGPRARWVVIAGSLPPGLPDDALAVLVRAVRARHGDAVRIAVDSSGVPFTALLQSGERLDLLKPNAEELAEAVGGDPDAYERDLDLAVDAAERLRARGVETVLLTLGSAGAVLVGPDGVFSAAAPRIIARSTVGAGDSALAGYLLAEVAGEPPERRLAQAVATGAAAAALPGSDVPALDHTDPDAIVVVRRTPHRHEQHPHRNATRVTAKEHTMTAERTTSPGLISVPLVGLDEDLGATSADVIRVLADRVAASGRAASGEYLAADAIKREASVGTGVPGGIAIPHARSASVTDPTLAMSRLARTVPFGAPDGDADLVFMIAVPEGADKDHLTVLSTLARALIREDFTAALRAATTQQEIVDLVDREVTGEVADAGVTGAPRASSPAAPTTAPAAGRKVIVGVTACPTGIAHTYMAADALVAAAQRAGAEMHVETQGSSQVEPLDPALIARADAVVFAVDVDVRDRSRFAGKPLVSGPVKRGVDEPDAMIAEALRAADDPNAARVSGSAAEAGTSTASNEHFGQSLKRWLLTGVSYMIPFVAGGGLLIALGFLLAGYGIALTHGDSGQNNAVFTLTNSTLVDLPPQGLGYYLGAAAFQIGSVSLGFLVAALAGYIAYAIADRPGIAPGFVAGSIAVFMNAGFLGGLVGGLIAGAAAYWIGRIPTWRWLRGLMPVVVIPLFASIIASGLMLLVLGGPIAWLMTQLTEFLNSLSGASAVLLGIILGLMMAFDLGGPVNKVAYAFAVAGLGAGTATNVVPFEIMAAVMAAGMVPPLALALASTVLYRRGFTKPERENGKAAWLLGASFISEGAIPFAAADPLRVIPASMVGAAVTGAITMAAGVTSRAPHGGIFVFFAIGGIWMFILAILVGTVVSALVLVALKKWVRRAPAEDADGAGAAAADQAAVAGETVGQRAPVAA